MSNILRVGCNSVNVSHIGGVSGSQPILTSGSAFGPDQGNLGLWSNSTDLAGVIWYQASGSNIPSSPSQILTVNFNSQYETAPFVFIGSVDGEVESNHYVPLSLVTTSSFVLMSKGNIGSGYHQFSYFVIQ